MANVRNGILGKETRYPDIHMGQNNCQYNYGDGEKQKKRHLILPDKFIIIWHCPSRHLPRFVTFILYIFVQCYLPLKNQSFMGNGSLSVLFLVLYLAFGMVFDTQ